MSAGVHPSATDQVAQRSSSDVNWDGTVIALQVVPHSAAGSAASSWVLTTATQLIEIRRTSRVVPTSTDCGYAM